jgi:hypothetical protein
MTQPTLDLFVPDKYDKGRIVALLRRLQHGIDVAALLQPLAKGDLLYADTNTTIDGLAIGSAGKILRSTGTLPAWTTLTFPDTITRGGVFYGSASNVASVLAVGSSGQVLTNNGTDVSWGTGTTITVADTTDSTCFVALFESATGNLGPKTDAGITYNATTAALTATTFVGDLIGNADTVTVDDAGVDAATLLHFDGSDGSTTFTDSGISPVSFTASGNAQLDTAQQKFGTASVYLDGTGSYASGTIGTRPSGSWTLQGWVNFDTILAFSNNYVFTWGTPAALAVEFRWNTSNWVAGFSSNGSTFDIGSFNLTGAPSPVVDTWIHWAVVFNQSAGEYYAFVNGVKYLTVTSSTLVYDNASNALYLGSNRTLSQDFIGWIDEVAYFKTEAVWTADFTPPTEPYVAADSTMFPMLATDATGRLYPRTDLGLTYNAATNTLTADNFVGSLTGSITGNAATVTHADETSDTTCFITFATAASGSLPVKTNTNMTFNASTGVATFASTVLTTTDINGGTVDGAVIGGSSAAAITGTTITANTGFMPDANDGAYLGQSGTAFSDLFLASGAVVDFAAGDVVLTHSSNALTLTGGVLVVPDTGLTVGASVPFSDSAGTLTLQNVDALDATTEATIEAAIDTLANLTSVQGRTVTLADAGANAFFGWQDTDGAYKNLTASEALEIIKTVDGSGSGLDADLLDGNSSAHFATAADLTAHIGDTSDAHDASAISVADSGGLLAATDVEAALAELATVDTVANEATDTTCFPVFVTAATGLLPLKTNANMSFNSNTGVATFASTVLTTTDINGGTVDNAVIGGSTPAAITGTALYANTSLVVSPQSSSLVATAGSLAPLTQLNSTGANGSSILLSRWIANAAAVPRITGGKSRGATVGAHTAVLNNDDLFSVVAEGSDGTAFQRAVEFLFEVDAAVSSGIVPGRVSILTADTSGALTEAIRFNSAQRTTIAQQVGIGTSPLAGTALDIRSTQTGTTQRGVNVEITFTSATTAAQAYRTAITLGDSGSDITYADVVAFQLGNVTKARAGDTITKLSYVRTGTSAPAALNLSYEGLLNVSGTARWNCYMSGTAPNYFEGEVMLGTTTSGSAALTFGDAKNIAFHTTTGTKVGTATSQKIGFWNATPIVQPTTAVAAATFVANTSGIANDTATFDGYTLGQVVKALRNAGLLA